MGSANGEWTSGDFAAVIGNYHYVVNVDPDRAAAHDPIIPRKNGLW